MTYEYGAPRPMMVAPRRRGSASGDLKLPSHQNAEGKVQQQPNRPQQKCENQARDHGPMRNALSRRISHFPTSDEQVKGQIVYPSGQQEPAMRKERRYT